MNKAEALLYLPIESEEELEDLWLEKLFEYKQFFISKSPIIKVFKGKLKKVEKLSEAYVTLGGVETAETVQHVLFKFDQQEIEGLFNYYQKIRGQFKLLIHGVQTANGLVQFVNQYLYFEKAYAAVWPQVQIEEGEQISVGVESDVMEFLNQIKIAKGEGVVFLKDLEKTRE